ncbi:two-component system cell cycle sensor histidine kinase/response regulator CckA [Shimia isoporae]|uniref:histidine kinase n=1 Tax=Shimia isoporae TaxID=647720 RepID=A0A4R1NRM6_9RHOB|nr:ATP-binding protein [Shimia isoporae]TCL09393.1 two-component system cell cycle sensor histidine kinase/response regulator CckA [Shimia isoporae]
MALLGASLILDDAMLQMILIGTAVVILLSLLVLRFRTARIADGSAVEIDLVKALSDREKTEQILTDSSGTILFVNAAAQAHSKASDEFVADFAKRRAVDGEGLVTRLLDVAAEVGHGQETVPQRDGSLVVTVSRMPSGSVHWAFEIQHQTAEAPQSGAPRLPMLTVGRSGTILFMNPAARTLLGERKKTLADVFGDRSGSPNEATMVMTAGGEQQCLVAEFEATAGRREIYLLPTEVPVVREGAVLFDELPVALLKLDREGKVLMANRTARGLLDDQLTEETLLDDLLEGLGRSIVDWLAEAASGRGGHHSEFLRLKSDKKEAFVQVSLNRVVEGDTSSLIAVLSDATELKSLEAQFVQSQKMQAIGQLAGGVAHDFNNLLTAISGHCDLLLLRHDQGDPDFADLIQINQNANRAAALVGQLLAFSRKQNLRPEIVDLRNSLADLTHLLNRLVGEKVTLSLSNDPVLPAIRADKRQLEQVLMNLVVNARDAMPNGGEIRVVTEGLDLVEPLERDRVVVPVGKYVSISVTDEGTGIAPDKLQKVFEPFFTTKKTGEGTGLGLSTAYGIVKQTGGYIFVDSEVGVGTRFSLMFPAYLGDEDAAPVEQAPAKAKEASVSHSGVVMLVEDEAPVRSFATRALKMRGFTVLEAGSGEEAIELLETERPNVDVFVTDVIMPGVDGPTWVRQAREVYPDVPVIFVSGYAEDSFSDDQARITNSSFLPKPFSLGDLTEAVQSKIKTG